jgi:hypothetical protein
MDDKAKFQIDGKEYIVRLDHDVEFGEETYPKIAATCISDKNYVNTLKKNFYKLFDIDSSPEADERRKKDLD